jgi:CRP/FNR family transcriptional regulator
MDDKRVPGSLEAVARGQDAVGEPEPAAPCHHCVHARRCIPGGLEPADVARLAGAIRPRAPLRKGQTLLRPGSGRNQLFIVRSGCLRSSAVVASGEEQVVDFHLAGELVGFESCCSDPGHRARIVALERTTVCVADLGHLRQLACRIPGLQEQLHRLGAWEILSTRHHLLMMGRIGAMQRLALFLRTWAWRLRRAGLSDTDVTLPMSREDLASYLGMTQETVSRSISALGRAGVIEPRLRRVRIVDPDRLAAIAGVDVPFAA